MVYIIRVYLKGCLLWSHAIMPHQQCMCVSNETCMVKNQLPLCLPYTTTMSTPHTLECQLCLVILPQQWDDMQCISVSKAKLVVMTIIISCAIRAQNITSMPHSALPKIEYIASYRYSHSIGQYLNLEIYRFMLIKLKIILQW